jgi:hypothetical protein
MIKVFDKVKHILSPPNPFDQLPSDLIKLIFVHLATSAAEIALTCRRFKFCIDDEQLYKAFYPECALGEEKLKKFIGDVGKEGRLPRRVYKDLKTGNILLAWVPEKINGMPLTHKAIDDLKVKDRMLRGLYGSGQLKKGHWTFLYDINSNRPKTIKEETLTGDKLIGVLFSIAMSDKLNAGNRQFLFGSYSEGRFQISAYIKTFFTP